VFFQKLLNIAHLVVDFTAYLRKGDDAFIAPALGGALADVHQLKELLIVEEDVFLLALFLGDAALDFFQALDQLLELVGGKNNSVHFYICQAISGVDGCKSESTGAGELKQNLPDFRHFCFN
jgi:hypothetical protein